MHGSRRHGTCSMMRALQKAGDVGGFARERVRFTHTVRSADKRSFVKLCSCFSVPLVGQEIVTTKHGVLLWQATSKRFQKEAAPPPPTRHRNANHTAVW